MIGRLEIGLVCFIFIFLIGLGVILGNINNPIIWRVWKLFRLSFEICVWQNKGSNSRQSFLSNSNINVFRLAARFFLSRYIQMEPWNDLAVNTYTICKLDTSSTWRLRLVQSFPHFIRRFFFQELNPLRNYCFPRCNINEDQKWNALDTKHDF